MNTSIFGRFTIALDCPLSVFTLALISSTYLVSKQECRQIGIALRILCFEKQNIICIFVTSVGSVI